jgi:hypothetical protein
LIAVSRDAIYDLYRLPRPYDEKNSFIKEKSTGLDLSDSNQPANGKESPNAKVAGKDYVTLEHSLLTELDILDSTTQNG